MGGGVRSSDRSGRSACGLCIPVAQVAQGFSLRPDASYPDGVAAAKATGVVGCIRELGCRAEAEGAVSGTASCSARLLLTSIVNNETKRAGFRNCLPQPEVWNGDLRRVIPPTVRPPLSPTPALVSVQGGVVPGGAAPCRLGHPHGRPCADGNQGAGVQERCPGRSLPSRSLLR